MTDPTFIRGQPCIDALEQLAVLAADTLNVEPVATHILALEKEEALLVERFGRAVP